jgi:mRNA interferase HigB
VRVVSRRTLTRFAQSRVGAHDHAALAAALTAWFHEVRRARWRSPADLKRHYRSASLIANDRVVFNIKGNAYRLIAAVDFAHGIVWIKWLGTHRDYDRIDARTVRYEKP